MRRSRRIRRRAERAELFIEMDGHQRLGIARRNGVLGPLRWQKHRRNPARLQSSKAGARMKGTTGELV